MGDWRRRPGDRPGNRVAGMTKQHIAQIGSATYPAVVNCE
jgi:hypothetical protein